METPNKKNTTKINKRHKALLLILLFLLIAAILLGFGLTKKPESTGNTPVPSLAPLGGQGEEVASIQVFHGEELAYEIYKEGEEYRLAGYEGLPLEEAEIGRMFAFVNEIKVEEKLNLNSEESEEASHSHGGEPSPPSPSTTQEEKKAFDKEDFGLLAPSVKVIVHPTKGQAWSFAFGDQVPFENLYYFEYKEEEAVYTVEIGFFDMFNWQGNFLVAIEDLGIHRQRVDQIDFTLHEQNQRVVLKLKDEGEDQLFYWMMESPVTYPVDPQAMDSLLTEVQSLYLGAYVAEGSEENLEKYGFKTPLVTITITQKAATLGRVGMEGVYETKDYPEEETTLVVGAVEGDYVYYGLVYGKIYLISSLNTSLIKGVHYKELLLKKPALLPLETLEEIRVMDEGEGRTAKAAYQIQKVKIESDEQAPAGDGQEEKIEITASLDGKPIDQPTFKLGYTALAQVSAAGLLPDNYSWGKTIFALEMENEKGRVRVIELAPYDTLHEALRIDGEAIFYIRKGELQQAVQGLIQ